MYAQYLYVFEGVFSTSYLATDTMFYLVVRMGRDLALGLGEPKIRIQNFLIIRAKFLNDLLRPKFLFFHHKFLITFF